MSSNDDGPRNWMAVEVPLTEELKLERAIREVSAHSDYAKVRDLCCSLMRLNFHQQKLLTSAIGRISELELVLFLGASTELSDAADFVLMARDLCDELGIG